MRAIVASLSRNCQIPSRSRHFPVPHVSRLSNGSRRSFLHHEPFHGIPHTLRVHQHHLYHSGHDEPTIYALSTASGRAAIAVIRVSGSACTQVSASPSRKSQHTQCAIDLRGPLPFDDLPKASICNSPQALYPAPASVARNDTRLRRPDPTLPCAEHCDWRRCAGTARAWRPSHCQSRVGSNTEVREDTSKCGVNAYPDSVR
jgi:hypothetical protein